MCFTEAHFCSVGVSAFPLIIIECTGCSKLNLSGGGTLKDVNKTVGLWVDEGGIINVSSEGKAAK